MTLNHPSSGAQGWPVYSVFQLSFEHLLCVSPLPNSGVWKDNSFSRNSETSGFTRQR